MSHSFLICALDREQQKDVEASVAENMQPFNESGEWFKDGSRWDWYVEGGRYSNRLLGKYRAFKTELTIDNLSRFQEEQARELWWAYQQEERKDDPSIREYIYRLKADDTEDTLVAERRRTLLTAGVFLRGQRWYESDRLGRFGGKAATECEANGRGEGKCVVGSLKSGPCIICFNETREKWNEHFYSRFIRNLPPDTMLAGIDYHV